jgi:hypothetical protein
MTKCRIQFHTRATGKQTDAQMTCIGLGYGGATNEQEKIW